MITFNPAFDLYHSIFRMANIASRLEEGEFFEVERVRIWDYYLIFPDKVHKIKIKRDEKDMRELCSKLSKYNNPYERSGNNRIQFEQIRSVQISALKCLVSYGILNKEDYEIGRVAVGDRKALDDFIATVGKLPARENNSLSYLLLFSRNMPLTGIDGLKDRTRLLDSKYDAD